MEYKSIYKNQMIHAMAGGLLLIGMNSSSVYANTGSVTNVGNSFMNALKASGIRAGGWIHGGATLNPRDRKSVV